MDFEPSSSDGLGGIEPEEITCRFSTSVGMATSRQSRL